MNLMNEMLQAVKNRDGNRAKELLDQDPSLIQMKTDAGSLILTAVYNGAQAVADVLLAAGPELTIFEAAVTGQASRIRELTAANPNLANSPNEDGFTPLGLAAFFGQPEAVGALLESGAAVNALSQSKVSYVPSNTALHAALAGKRNPAVVERLIAAGADFEVVDSNGKIPLQVAAHSGDVENGERLLKAGARADAGSVEEATRQDKHEFVALLQRYGA